MDKIPCLKAPTNQLWTAAGEAHGTANFTGTIYDELSEAARAEHDLNYEKSLQAYAHGRVFRLSDAGTPLIYCWLNYRFVGNGPNIDGNEGDLYFVGNTRMTTFTPVDINADDQIVGTAAGHIRIRAAANALNGTPSDPDLGPGHPLFINAAKASDATGTEVSAPQVLGTDRNGDLAIWNKDVTASPATYQTTLLKDALPEKSGWTLNQIKGLNDHGRIIATATYRDPANPSALPETHGVLLLPVEITIKKQGENAPPEKGLVVLKNESVEIKLTNSSQQNFPILAQNITWSSRQLKSDGAYTAWADMGSTARGIKFFLQLSCRRNFSNTV